MSTLVKDRWFPLIELVLVLLAGALYMLGGYFVTWQPLLIALTPLGVRIAGDKHFYRRNLIGILLLLFGVTAVTGVFLAYDTAQAFQKLFVMIVAVLLLYALMAQSRRDIWTVAAILGIISVGIVGYFLQTNDWEVLPADIDIINRIGLRWMGIRPYLPIPVIHANAAGGLLAIILPFQIALAWYARRVKHSLYWWIAVGTGFVALVGLLFTSSRGAWVGLAAAFFLWQLWVQTEKVAQRMQRAHWLIFGAAVVGLAVVGLVLLFVVRDRIWGISTVNTRLMLDSASIDLIGDYPFFGAGLASFGGLYSQYIAVTPFFLFNYGHFFWLDMVLEQGVLGLLFWLGIYGVSVWLLVKMPDNKLTIKAHMVGNGRSRRQVPARALEISLFRWAILISIITHLIHTLVDDPLYAFVGTPFLFLLPGLCLMLVDVHEIPRLTMPRLPRVRLMQIGGASAAVLAIVLLVLWRPLFSNWYAMSGAVQMAKIELANWPLNEWNRYPDLDGLAAAAEKFEQALALDPTNRTANHRLGLIEMQNQVFDTAVSHLEAAYQQDPDHIGIVKSLGFSYVWQGNYDAAAPLLDLIPEAQYELENYVSWWEGNGRDDLADHAANMLEQMAQAAPVDAVSTIDAP